MTANVNILRGDLHLAVSTAFNRGRYVLMTGGGDGAPIEITIDLRERPDDLFEAEGRGFSMGEIVGMFSGDDHGPAIPAQESFDDGLDRRLRETFRPGPFAADPGPRVYEFALQDARETTLDKLTGQRATLKTCDLSDAPDRAAAEAADWVHVYDRVTRERRTLKRPEPDAVLTGLRDVAADLRRKATPYVGQKVTVTDAKGVRGPGRIDEVWDSGSYGVQPLFAYACQGEENLRAPGSKQWWFHAGQTEDFGLKIEFVPFTPERGSPVEPPFGCAPLPPVGPLTSTEGLRSGDVLRVIEGAVGWEYGPVRLSTTQGGHPWPILACSLKDGINARFTVSEVTFVGRPDADGWIVHSGGGNPVPGARVEFRCQNGYTAVEPSDDKRWSHDDRADDIVAFRIVDTPPAV